MVTSSMDILIIFMFIPLIWAFGLTGYAYWVKNDYSALMDIPARNKEKKKQKDQEYDIMIHAKKYQD